MEDYDSGLPVLASTDTKNTNREYGTPARIMSEIKGKLLMSVDKMMIIISKARY